MCINRVYPSFPRSNKYRYSRLDLMKIVNGTRGFSIHQKVNINALIKSEWIFTQDDKRVGVFDFTFRDGSVFRGTNDEAHLGEFESTIIDSAYVESFIQYGPLRYVDNFHYRFFSKNSIGKDLCEVCGAKTNLNSHIEDHNLCGRCEKKRKRYEASNGSSFEGFLVSILSNKKFIKTLKEEGRP